MQPPQSPPGTSYYVKQGEQEIGPLSLAQLNRMRSMGQLAANSPCRKSTDPAHQPLGVMFPHLADHERKSAEEHKQAARLLEGNGLANTALGCSLLAWVIAAPVLSWFGIILGARSYLFAHRPAGLFAVLIGILAFMFWLARFLNFIPSE